MFPNSTVGHWAAWTVSFGAVTVGIGLSCFLGKAVERRRGPSAMFNYDLWKFWVPFAGTVTIVLFVITLALWAA